MNFLVANIVSAVVPWPNVQQKCGVLIGLNCILLCLNNSSPITKFLLDQHAFLIKGRASGSHYLLRAVTSHSPKDKKSKNWGQ